MTDHKAEAAKVRLDALNGLRTAIAKLCEPFETRAPIKLGTKRGHRVHVVTHLPLIQQLRNAITANFGVGPGGSSAPDTRALVDAGAFDLYQEVRATIKDVWYASAAPDLRYDSRRKPEENLAEWLDLIDNDDTPTGLLTKWSKTYGRWVERIEALFEPGENLQRLCPECGHVWKHIASEIVSLNVRTLSVTCPVCSKSWSGLAELEVLAATFWTGTKVALEA